MVESFQGFFSSQGFAPHGVCLAWQPSVFWTQVGSDAVIAASYFSIPIVIAVYAAKRRPDEGRWVLHLFVTFIVACGITHLFGIWTMWNPDYGIEAVVKTATAGASFVTAVALWFLLPTALHMPSSGDLRSANRRLESEIRRRIGVQEELEALNLELETRVSQRTAAFEEANKKLQAEVEKRAAVQDDLEQARRAAESADRAKTTFLASMSHEVRTPLNAILGFAELLEMSSRRDLSDKEKDYLGSIRQAGTMLKDLINDILELAKIEEGKTPIEIEETPAREILTPVQDQMRVLCSGAGLKCHFENELDEDSPIVTDSLRVRQILGNFVSNAVKYNNPHGDVFLAVKPVDGGKIEISVTDTGPGIRDEHLDRLFKPFDRLGRSGGEIEGTGIGLPISLRLAEAIGGTIRVESSHGSGSRFTLTIPRNASASIAATSSKRNR